MRHFLLKSTTTIFLFILLCFTCNDQLHAQQAIDTNEIKINIQLCIDSFSINPAFTKNMLTQTLEASKQAKYPWGILMTTNISGAMYSTEGNYKEALKLHEEALKYCRAHKFRQKESTILGNIARDYLGFADHQKAISIYQESLVVAQDIKDTAQMAAAIEGIGNTFNSMGYYTEAIKYLSRSVPLYIQKKKYGKAQLALNNISAAYIDAHKYDSAYRYAWLSLAQYKKAMPGAQPPVGFYVNIALCYDSLHRKDSAAYYYSKAVERCRETGDEQTMQSALYNMACVYGDQGKWVKAIEYYKEALEYSEKYNNLEGTVNICTALSGVYARMGDYKKAYLYVEKGADATDSLLNHEKIRAIEELNTKFETQQLKYEYEKKELLNKVTQEKNIASLTVANEKKITRRNILLYAFIFIAVLLLTGIFFLIKYFRQKTIITDNKNEELKQRLLLTQMNPHFIFNSVDNIQSLIHSNKDEEAVNYLTKFSKLTRQILENSRENYISLAEELNMLDNYITIQKLLYNNNFSHKVTVDDNIDPEAILLPPMLTQPFIENAIKHGLKSKNENGIVNVRFYMKEGQLFFEVTDNGTGLAVKDNEAGQRSLSTQITKERLESIASKKKIIIHTLNITGTNDDVQGVKTFFEIPYVYNN